MVRISNKDLLKLLQKNARTKGVALAKELNVTETAIRKRIKKLESEGIITGYTVDINPKKAGYETQVLIGIDTTPESFMKIKEYLINLDFVINAWTSTGDHMLMAECWFKTKEDHDNFIKELEAKPEITKTCPALILNKIK